MTIFINPGSGPVDNATEHLAVEATQKLIDDVGLDGVEFARKETDDEHGRYGFILSWKGRQVSIEMPGLEIDRVRFTGAADQNIWHFPRLYVDGSSWVWKFAVNSTRRGLTGEE